MADILYYEILKNTPKENRNFDRLSMLIAAKVFELLENKNLKQKELASLIKKKESEISKWLSGSHNFTLKTIAKLEAVLNEEIIEVTLKDNYKSGNVTPKINVIIKRNITSTVTLKGRTRETSRVSGHKSNSEIFVANLTSKQKIVGTVNEEQY